MACDLPAELLREILSPPLLVSDDMFADTGAVSPFSKVDKSASDVLLVCKSWMRAATPWLYSTVIVRSMAQAKALALALTNNPDFGKFIRRLRVEGAYGDYIWTAVKTASNITDLCMTLTVWSDISSAGLIKSLAHIDPRRVILTLTPEKPIKNKNHTLLLNALCAQIQKWSRLTTFKFSGSCGGFRRWSRTPDYVAFPALITALCASSSLEEVQLIAMDSSDTTVATIRQLLGENSRRTVTLYQTSRDSDSAFELHVQRLRAQASAQFLPRIHTKTISKCLDSALSSLGAASSAVTVPGPSEAEAWLPNPFYKPLGNADPLVRRALLSRIFRHALEIEPPVQGRYVNQGGDWFDASRFDTAVARSIITASEEFKMIAHKILVQHVSVECQVDLERLLPVVRGRPTLSEDTTTFHFNNSMVHTPTMVELLEHMPRLTDVTLCFSHVAIEALTRGGSSTTLRKLDLRSPWASTPATHPLNLDGFIALQELVISYPRYLNNPTDTIDLSDRGLVLPQLRRLRIESAPRYIVESLIAHDLPLLEYLHCGNGSLDAETTLSIATRHGARIREAYFYDVSAELINALPELVELHWTRAVLNIPSMTQSFAVEGHPNLRTFRVSSSPPTFQRRRKGNANLESMWKSLLTRVVTRDKFPALEEVQVREGYAIWPVNERDAKKSIWPPLAEGLEQQGISLIDREGRAWRRRLQ